MGSEYYAKNAALDCDRNFDKYDRLNLRKALETERDYITRFDMEHIRSPLGFGEVLIERPLAGFAEKYVHEWSKVLSEHAVEGVCEQRFTTYDPTDMSEGEAEETIRRLYPSQYHWTRDRLGSAPLAGAYPHPVQDSDRHKVGLSCDPEVREAYFDYIVNPDSVRVAALEEPTLDVSFFRDGSSEF